jgi:hypothetical protein
MGAVDNCFKRIIKSTSFKTPAPAPLQTTFFYWTTKVDIYNIWVYSRTILEDIAIASSSPPKFEFNRSFVIENIQFHSAFDRITNQPF